MERFTTPRLAVILGVPQRRLIDWCERGLIVADLAEAKGHASRREFSYQAGLRAALAFALKEKFNIPRDLIRNILDRLWLRGFFSDWANGDSGFLVVANPHLPDAMEWFQVPGNFDSRWAWLWRDAEAVLIIDLAKIKSQFDKNC